MTTNTTEHTITLPSKHLDAHYLADQKAVVVSAESPFIPEQDFKEAFLAIGDFVKANDVSKLVFDKRKLSTFHQPSMTWYHVDWKQELLDYGLKHHRKILPKDTIFRTSVEVGRKKIVAENPSFDIDKLDIQYFDTIEECLAN